VIIHKNLALLHDRNLQDQGPWRTKTSRGIREIAWRKTTIQVLGSPILWTSGGGGNRQEIGAMVDTLSTKRRVADAATSSSPLAHAVAVVPNANRIEAETEIVPTSKPSQINSNTNQSVVISEGSDMPWKRNQTSPGQPPTAAGTSGTTTDNNREEKTEEK
jgi:hypothetical protein